MSNKSIATIATMGTAMDRSPDILVSPAQVPRAYRDPARFETDATRGHADEGAGGMKLRAEITSITNEPKLS
jgi:hypothetical protein